MKTQDMTDTELPNQLYKIVRFDRKGSRTIFRGLTLEQAQAHCQNPSTEGNGWFDRYSLMNPEPRTLNTTP